MNKEIETFMKRESAIKNNLKNFNDIIGRVAEAYGCEVEAIFSEYRDKQFKAEEEKRRKEEERKQKELEEAYGTDDIDTTGGFANNAFGLGPEVRKMVGKVVRILRKAGVTDTEVIDFLSDSPTEKDFERLRARVGTVGMSAAAFNAVKANIEDFMFRADIDLEDVRDFVLDPAASIPDFEELEEVYTEFSKALENLNV